MIGNQECPPEFHRFKGLLKLDSVIKYNHHGSWLIVAPKEFQRLSHHQFCAGHLGVFKTHKRVLGMFW